MTNLENEWAILHQNIEKYEQFSLIIKLFSVLVFMLSIAFSIDALASVCVILVLWLQNGIWVTFQQRLEARVISIEAEIKNSSNKATFQLYSEWLKNRPSATKLISEYIINSLKPTVAYPYVILAGLLFAVFFNIAFV